MMRRSIKLFLGNLRYEMLRVFSSWKIYSCFFLYIILIFTAVKMDTNLAGQADGGLDIITGLSNLNKLLVITAAFPVATIYYDDIIDNYAKQVVLRSNKSSYILSKIVVCAIISFLISFAALLTYSIVVAFKRGIGIGVVYPGNVFYDYAYGRMPFMALFAKAFLFSIVSSVYAVLGLALSAVMTGKFVAVAAPLFMNMLMEQIGNIMPKELRLFNIQDGNSAYGLGTSGTLIVSIVVVAGYILLAGIFFSYYVRKRIKDEIN